MLFRRRYGGDLVHFRRDEAGVIEVVDKGDIRSLHFGNPNRQSALSLSQPDRLELSYIRAMLLNLVLAPPPENILILGLGGGSLAKFLLQQYPAARLIAVEYRSGMPPVAREFFGLPNDPRLTLIQADACDYICQAIVSDPPVFDHIYIDAFDQDGLSPSINQSAFFAACSQLLHPEGSLAINLWGHHRQCLDYSLRLLNTHFPNRILRLSVPDKSNVIGFALGRSVMRDHAEEIRRATELEQGLLLELPTFLAALGSY